MIPWDTALLALMLRHAHWLSLLAALVAIPAWTWRRAAHATNASGSWNPLLNGLTAGLLLAAACALAWPAAQLAHDWPEVANLHTQLVLASITAGGWFPGWSSLWTLSPDWPFAWRPEPSIPASAHALGQLEQSYWWLGLALIAALASLALHRPYAKLLALSAAAVLVAARPYPKPQLLLAPAHAASLRQPDTAFTAESILAGRAHYLQHCAQCHGAQADGRGPLAANQPTWPSVLGPALFRHRTAGELYQTIASGITGPGGVPRMPAHDSALSPGDIWQVLDFLRALAAGTEARQGGWQQALPAPDLPLSCLRGNRHNLRALAGQPVHLIAYAKPPEMWRSAPMSDPRLTTVLMLPSSSRPAVSADAADDGRTHWPWPADVDCVAYSDHGLQAYALVAGADPAYAQDRPIQFLLDRQQWLRSRQLADDPDGWSAADTMCLPPAGAVTAAPSASASAAGGAASTLSESTLAATTMDALLHTLDTVPVDAPRFRLRFPTDTGTLP